jgi:hypothetical protein
MFYPGYLIRIQTFSHSGIPVPDAKIFHTGTFIKRGIKKITFLLLFIVSGASLNTGSPKENKSRIRKKIIPDPGGEKAPDPRSATRNRRYKRPEE